MAMKKMVGKCCEVRGKKGIVLAVVLGRPVISFKDGTFKDHSLSEVVLTQGPNSKLQKSANKN